MCSLEEEFILFTDRANDLDHATLDTQREELREELVVLDHARLDVPDGLRRTTLDMLSRTAFRVLERRIYALEHPTVLGPDRRRER